jgi:AAA15 family ATPase/GTPase
MITEIKISNFRSLGQDVKISGLGPLVVFTGRNGSGKSNVLDALNEVLPQNWTSGISLEPLHFRQKSKKLWQRQGGVSVPISNPKLPLRQ